MAADRGDLRGKNSQTLKNDIASENRTLDSWKEIATFLRRGVRTVQRWERTEHLPVYRHNHMRRGSVYAYASDLVAWQRARHLGYHFTHSEPELMNIDQFMRLRSLTLRQTALVNEMKNILSATNLMRKKVRGEERIARVHERAGALSPSYGDMIAKLFELEPDLESKLDSQFGSRISSPMKIV
jgi:hypothetical protein